MLRQWGDKEVAEFQLALVLIVMDGVVFLGVSLLDTFCGNRECMQRRLERV